MGKEVKVERFSYSVVKALLKKVLENFPKNEPCTNIIIILELLLGNQLH